MENKVVREGNKVYFNPGDIVYFKGTPEFEQYPMLVRKMVFKEDEKGKYERKEDGSKIPIGVLVTFFPSIVMGEKVLKGEPLDKIVDSRRVYKKEYKATYYLHEVKKIFVNEGKTELVELVNSILNKL